MHATPMLAHPPRLLLALLIAAPMALPVSAGEPKVYRCGDSYSQVPCGENATQPKLYGAQGAEASTLEKATSCAAAVATSRAEEGVEWQLRDASEPAAELIDVHGSRVLGYRVDVTMVQMASFGQRSPLLTFRCMVSQDFQRVLSVQSIP